MSTDTDPYRDADFSIECLCGNFVAVNENDPPHPCPSCGATVTEPKMFRVLVLGRTYHYETVEAQNTQHAKEAVDNGQGERESEPDDAEYEAIDAEEIHVLPTEGI